MSVSVVIPVYNAEQYLARCLDGVCAQDDCVSEIIIVDDGSTDGSRALCEEYAQKDGRVKVLTKPNEGAEAAVVDGVNAATGEYIAFADADDCMEPNMLRELYDGITKYDADLAFCDYDDFDESGRFYGKRDFGVKCGLHEKHGGRFDFNLLPTFEDGKFASGSRWNKLIKKSLIVDNIAFGRNGIVMSEDTALMVPIMMSAQKIVYVDKCLYHYFQCNSSVSHSYSRRFVDDWTRYIALYEKGAKEYGYSGVNIDEAAVCLLLQYCIFTVRKSGPGFFARRREYAYIGKRPEVKAALKAVRLSGLPRKKRAALRLLKAGLYGVLAAVLK